MQKFKHRKSGGIYVVQEHVILQSKMPLEDMSTLVLYRGVDGQGWVRPIEEFYDGRFEHIV